MRSKRVRPKARTIHEEKALNKETLTRRCGLRFKELGVAGTVYISCKMRSPWPWERMTDEAFKFMRSVVEKELAKLDLPETKDSLGPLTSAFWGIDTASQESLNSMPNHSLTRVREPNSSRRLEATGDSFDLNLTTSPGTVSSSANSSRASPSTEPLTAPDVEEILQPDISAAVSSCALPQGLRGDTVWRDDTAVDGFHSVSSFETIALNPAEDAVNLPGTTDDPESASLERSGSGNNDHSQVNGDTDVDGSTSLFPEHAYCSSNTRAPQRQSRLKRLNPLEPHYHSVHNFNHPMPGSIHSGLKRLRTNANGTCSVSKESFTNTYILPTQLLPIYDLTYQLQLSIQRKVPDTAESILFAMKGDTSALKRLFGEGLASPVEVSSSRELSLLGVLGALRRKVELSYCSVSSHGVQCAC
ncbi:hypothetical protein EJ05DRAFT_321466 [Pseudovirgaria hyperparasitica]|uniref:Uncharacterized protein n=1 Tax=Pseudovirgaria hyperparasitica TaxID=470096 RepID=A0A6A6VT89_9PEZI|nr:uncharacterized protein EJ05DRAFT_321466 [Pseudovirgaria hyperparasitica]KAF2752491.1 hypothetical protein EJ05DRAFT_321466 [Pseudovirgaria hyperparasitica]